MLRLVFFDEYCEDFQLIALRRACLRSPYLPHARQRSGQVLYCALQAFQRL
jgi:hypothetical protein